MPEPYRLGLFMSPPPSPGLSRAVCQVILKDQTEVAIYDNRRVYRWPVAHLLDRSAAGGRDEGNWPQSPPDSVLRFAALPSIEMRHAVASRIRGGIPGRRSGRCRTPDVSGAFAIGNCTHDSRLHGCRIFADDTALWAAWPSWFGVNPTDLKRSPGDQQQASG